MRGDGIYTRLYSGFVGSVAVPCSSVVRDCCCGVDGVLMSDREDRSSWIRSILEQYERPLTRYAARLVGDEDAARDVVQETFLRLCAEDRRDLNGHIAPWLYAVCRSRAVDARRKGSRMATVTQERLETCSNADPAVIAESRESGSKVAEAMALLTENQQEVIRLRFTDGLSYKEIAEVTKLSVSNVGYLIHTAVKALRERLKG